MPVAYLWAWHAISTGLVRCYLGPEFWDAQSRIYCGVRNWVLKPQRRETTPLLYDFRTLTSVGRVCLSLYVYRLQFRPVWSVSYEALLQAGQPVSGTNPPEATCGISTNLIAVSGTAFAPGSGAAVLPYGAPVLSRDQDRCMAWLKSLHHADPYTRHATPSLLIHICHDPDGITNIYLLIYALDYSFAT
jgi:hypothetical protein